MEQIVQFISNHWLLALALVVILILLFVNETLTQKNRTKALSPQTVVNKINHDNAVVIDIREKEQFDKGHIIDSLNLLPEAFEHKSTDKYKKKTIVLACNKGIQSLALTTKLSTLGFEEIYVLEGGIEGWKAAGLPLVKS